MASYYKKFDGLDLFTSVLFGVYLGFQIGMFLGYHAKSQNIECDKEKNKIFLFDNSKGNMIKTEVKEGITVIIDRNKSSVEDEYNFTRRLEN